MDVPGAGGKGSIPGAAIVLQGPPPIRLGVNGRRQLEGVILHLSHPVARAARRLAENSFGVFKSDVEIHGTTPADTAQPARLDPLDDDEGPAFAHRWLGRDRLESFDIRGSNRPPSDEWLDRIPQWQSHEEQKAYQRLDHSMTDAATDDHPPLTAPDSVQPADRGDQFVHGLHLRRP